MLQHSLITQRMSAVKPPAVLERRTSSTASRDEAYTARMETLRKSEEALVEREREIKNKEKELESRCISQSKNILVMKYIVHGSKNQNWLELTRCGNYPCCSL